MNKYMGDFGRIPMPTDKMELDQAKYELQKVQIILSLITASLLTYSFFIKKKF